MSVAFTEAPLGCSLDSHQWTAKMNERGEYYEMCCGCGKQTAWMALRPSLKL